MKAYWFDNLPVRSQPHPSIPSTHIRSLTKPPYQGDQRLPHDSGRPVPASKLSDLGIIHHHLPNNLAAVNQIASDRHYQNRDEVEISPTTLPNYEAKVQTFFHEHLHEDEEIRYILQGAGYFDVRGREDDWIRIRLEEGDMMILPAGIYHRFTTDERNYTKAMRLFKEDPKWTPLRRGVETDANAFRTEYLKGRDGVVA